MAGSNERGRALEYLVGIELHSFLENEMNLDVLSSESTKRLNFRDKPYFDALSEKDKADFGLCAKAFLKWLKQQDWLDNAETVTIDRFGDDKAKKKDPTDIQLAISNRQGQLVFKNISVKHRHNALCHPRLPSLAQQCEFEKASKEDTDYRKSYEKIWNNFYKKVKTLNKMPKTYSELDKLNKDYKIKWLYAPLQKHTVDFLRKHANMPEHAKAFFKYLIGKKEYIVLKNGKKHIEIKHFEGIANPISFEINYPFHAPRIEIPQANFLMSFNNGWKVKIRLHTASGRIEKNGKIFMTEKEDPTCKNLENVIKIENIKKN